MSFRSRSGSILIFKRTATCPRDNEIDLLRNILPVLKENCRWRATNGGECLDQHLQEFVGRSLHGKLVNPFFSLIRSRCCQLALLIMSIYPWYSFASNALVFKEYGSLVASSFLLNATMPNASVGILTAQLMRHGCPLPSQLIRAQNYVFFADYLTVEFDLFSPSTITGLKLALGNGSEHAKVGGVRLALTMFMKNDEGLSSAGPISVRKTSKGLRFLSGNITLEHQLAVDYTAPWPLVLKSIFEPLIQGLGFVAISLCGAAKRVTLAKRIAAMILFLVAASSIVCGAGYIALGYLKDSLCPLAHCVANLALSAVLWFSEAQITECGALAGVIVLSIRAISDCALWSDCANLADDPPVTIIIGTVLCFGLVAVRLSFCVSSIQAVSHDLELYLEYWASLKSQQGMAGSLDRLRAVVDIATGTCGASHARHLNRKRLADGLSQKQVSKWPFLQKLEFDEAIADLFSMSSTYAGQGDPSQPVLSLSQLYSQALCVSAILARWCDELARSCGGELCTPSARKSLIKDPSRAADKAHCCYLGDVSRLLDICRARICFRSVEDVASCLEGLMLDNRVKIVRVKNLMGRSDSIHSGGFRCVIINMRFDTNEARLLGVEQHIFELQLLLSDFPFVQEHGERQARHARYLRLRFTRTLASMYPYRWLFSRFSQPDSEALFQLRAVVIAPRGLQDADDEVFDSFGRSGLFSRIASNESTTSQAPISNTAASPIATLIRRTSSSSSSVPEITPVEEAVYRIQLRSSLRKDDLLDVIAKRSAQAFWSSSPGSVMFTSTPIAAAASKHIFQLVFFLASVYYAYVGSSLLRRYFQPLQIGALRLSPTLLRNATLLAHPSVTPPAVADFGGFLRGCRVAPGKISRNGSSFTVEYARPVEVDGYFFVTGPDEGADPVSWLISYTSAVQNPGSAGERAWTTVSASALRGSPPRRGSEVSFAPPYAVYAADSSRLLVWSSGLLGCALAGAARRLHLAKPCLVSAILLGAAMTLAVAVAYAASDDRTADLRFAGADQGLQGYARDNLYLLPEQWVLGLGLALLEAWALTVFVVYAALQLGRNLLAHPQWSAAQKMEMGAYFLIVAALILLYRRWVLYNARALVMPDKVGYDRAWAAMLDDPPCAAALADIKACADAMVDSTTPSRPRQLAGPPWSPFAPRADGDAQGGVDVVDAARAARVSDSSEPPKTAPLGNMDDLYIQAVGAHPFLLEKTKEYATACGGLFPVLEQGGEKLVSLGQRRRSQFRIKWADAKKLSRACEKLQRVYKQDVSLLVDVCRQSIIFESAGSLANCLRLITADPEVQVVRVKNRLDPSFDSSASGGYRDVGLNLRVITEETRELGLDSHVCELQLLLRAVWELKSEVGHSRYVAFRNLRGE